MQNVINALIVLWLVALSSLVVFDAKAVEPAVRKLPNFAEESARILVAAEEEVRHQRIRTGGTASYENPLLKSLSDKIDSQQRVGDHLATSVVKLQMNAVELQTEVVKQKIDIENIRSWIEAMHGIVKSIEEMAVRIEALEKSEGCTD